MSHSSMNDSSPQKTTFRLIQLGDKNGPEGKTCLLISQTDFYDNILRFLLLLLRLLFLVLL